MRLNTASVLMVVSIAFAKQSSDIPVTSNLSDYDANNTAYYLQSDALGAYQNGTAANSILVANGYNGITWGDWRLDLSNSTTRSIRVTFAQANAVQPGDPGYTAPANPPYWGTKFEAVRMENKCSLDHHDMLTMNAGDKFNCDLSIRFPPATSSTYYRLDMDPTLVNAPEAQQVQVSCNAANSGGCSDWFLDPIPVVNPDGTTSPGQTRGRLNLVNTHGAGSTTDEGDFYMTFHFHVTRP
ncbi:MAG TPA: hypothetical protein VKR61_24800 [Bryobacteraceae bacterium]|nr:hypothetical protein [Bryobacteraceae bacterium]